MPALTDRATRTGAGVRKPSGDETAGGTARSCRPARAGLWGFCRRLRAVRGGVNRQHCGFCSVGVT
jgi:hypothetical protein